MYLKFLTLLFGLLVVFPSSGFAEGFPKLPAGEHYYCTGRKHSVFRFGYKIISEEPEVFAVFRLKPSDELVVKKGYEPCIIDNVNEESVREFMNGKDDWIFSRSLSFKINVFLNNKKISVLISAGGASSYETDVLKDYPVRKINHCGVIEENDEFGLIKIDKKCGSLSPSYLGINHDYKNNQVINRCSKSKCVLQFFSHGFGLNVVVDDKSYRENWEEFVDLLKAEIDERMVVHISPERCLGPLDCSKIVEYSK